MRYLVLALNVFILGCCGTPGEFPPLEPCNCFDDPREVKDTNPEFLEFISSFEDLIGESVGDIPINFDEPEEFTENDDGTRIIGFCRKLVTYPNNVMYKEIKVLEEYWNTTDYYGKEFLVFHELGHCFLNRDHTKEKIEHNWYTIPKSMMYPNVFGESYHYQEKRDYYHEELISERN